MSDLLHDVDDMMRAERLRTLWNEYGNYLIGAVLILIAGVAADQAYQSWRLMRAQQAGAALHIALQAPDPVAALVEVGKTNGQGAGAMADILAAQRLVADKKPDQAIPLLLAVRNNSNIHKDLRALATLLWARLVAADPAVPVSALKGALSPLMQDEGYPFAWAARMDMAVILADRAEDPEAAVNMLAPMLDNAALPQTQVQRARLLSDLYKGRLTRAKGK